MRLTSIGKKCNYSIMPQLWGWNIKICIGVKSTSIWGYVKRSVSWVQISVNLYLYNKNPNISTGCPILDVDNFCLLCIEFYVWDAVSIFNHLPMMFLSTDFAFRITDWTCCIGPHLHAILRIISRGVSGAATDCPCVVWGRGWTTRLLHDNPLFGSHFKPRVGI